MEPEWINTLPIEIWEYILYMVDDLISIVNISTTCWFFKGLINPKMLIRFVNIMLYNRRVRRYGYWRKLIELALPNHKAIKDIPWMIHKYDSCEYKSMLWGLNKFQCCRSCPVQYIFNFQTEKICRQAMKAGRLRFDQVENQTNSLCILAIEMDWLNLGFIKEESQTKEIIMTAIRINWRALQFVVNQTDEICLKSVMINGLALQYVQNETPEICYVALGKNPFALQFVENQTNKMCLFCVKQNGLVLKYVEN